MLSGEKRAKNQAPAFRDKYFIGLAVITIFLDSRLLALDSFNT